MPPGIHIQPGLPAGQLPAAIALFDVAFESKMALAIPEGAVRRRFFAHVFCAESCLSATLDGKVVGFVGFQTPTVAFSGGITGTGVPWVTIRRELGFLAGLRAALFFGFFRRRPEPGTLLLDGVTVDSSLRGRGVGRLLLQAVLAHAAAQGYDRVKLGVLDTNVVARTLYEKVGFAIVATKSFGFLRAVLGFGGYHVMVCPLEPEST